MEVSHYFHTVTSPITPKIVVCIEKVHSLHIHESVTIQKLWVGAWASHILSWNMILIENDITQS